MLVAEPEEDHEPEDGQQVGQGLEARLLLGRQLPAVVLLDGEGPPAGASTDRAIRATTATKINRSPLPSRPSPPPYP